MSHSYKKNGILGHKGAVKVKPLNGNGSRFPKLKDVYLIDKSGRRILLGIWEVRKYRRGRFLVKFKDLKWRNDIEGYKNFVMAV